ncbi:hypothetical protein JCM14469_15090 [Desulfatiferula olefinivorans]
MAKRKKNIADDTTSTDRSLKKRLAVATVAASLGVSLGVPVGRVMAEEAGMKTLPAYSVKDRVAEQMDELDAETSNQDVGESTEMKKESSMIKWDTNRLPVTGSEQFKWDKQSTQIKLDTMESNQFKWDKESTQIKIENHPIRQDIDAEGFQGNE